MRRAEPDAWLADVARITERRCPIRTLLTDAGVALEMTWIAVPRESAASRPLKPGYIAWRPSR